MRESMMFFTVMYPTPLPMLSVVGLKPKLLNALGLKTHRKSVLGVEA